MTSKATKTQEIKGSNESKADVESEHESATSIASTSSDESSSKKSVLDNESSTSLSSSESLPWVNTSKKTKTRPIGRKNRHRSAKATLNRKSFRKRHNRKPSLDDESISSHESSSTEKGVSNKRRSRLSLKRKKNHVVKESREVKRRKPDEIETITISSDEDDSVVGNLSNEISSATALSGTIAVLKKVNFNFGKGEKLKDYKLRIRSQLHEFKDHHLDLYMKEANDCAIKADRKFNRMMSGNRGYKERVPNEITLNRYNQIRDYIRIKNELNECIDKEEGRRLRDEMKNHIGRIDGVFKITQENTLFRKDFNKDPVTGERGSCFYKVRVVNDIETFKAINNLHWGTSFKHHLPKDKLREACQFVLGKTVSERMCQMVVDSCQGCRIKKMSKEDILSEVMFFGDKALKRSKKPERKVKGRKLQPTKETSIVIQREEESSTVIQRDELYSPESIHLITVSLVEAYIEDEVCYAGVFLSTGNKKATLTKLNNRCIGSFVSNIIDYICSNGFVNVSIIISDRFLTNLLSEEDIRLAYQELLSQYETFFNKGLHCPQIMK